MLNEPKIDQLISDVVPKFLALPNPFKSLKKDSFEICMNFRMRSNAGRTLPSKNKIELNPHLIKDEETFKEVLIHELCHLVVSRQNPYAAPHGSTWQKLMVTMGMQPKRCHRLPVENGRPHSRWKISCFCQTHLVTTRTLNNMRRGKKYMCRKCKSLLQI